MPRLMIIYSWEEYSTAYTATVGILQADFHKTLTGPGDGPLFSIPLVSERSTNETNICPVKVKEFENLDRMNDVRLELTPHGLKIRCSPN